MPWKLKVDENNVPVFEEKDGQMLPVYIDPDGAELPLDPPAMYQKISDMGKANQADRKKYTTLRDQMKAFDGVEDLTEWKKKADEALKTVENLADKDMIDAKKVDDLKAQINSAWEEKIKNKDIAIADMQKEHQILIEGLNGKIRKLLISNQFASSKHFNGADKITVLRPDVGEAYFGSFFSVEEGKDGEPVVRAYFDRNHEQLVVSKTNPGEPAEFEEALGMIIDRDPDKESLLRSTKGGSGGGGGGGDDDLGTTDVKKLEKQYAEAQKINDVRTMISIKNKLSEARLAAAS